MLEYHPQLLPARGLGQGHLEAVPLHRRLRLRGSLLLVLLVLPESGVRHHASLGLGRILGAAALHCRRRRRPLLHALETVDFRPLRTGAYDTNDTEQATSLNTRKFVTTELVPGISLIDRMNNQHGHWVVLGTDVDDRDG